MRVAIVNDNPMALEALRRVLARESRFQLVWTATDGAVAVQRCAESRPDLILMDLVMPVMNGVEATREIMARTPCPILIVTASTDELCPQIFQALSAGACDVVQAPAIMGPRASVEIAALFLKMDRHGATATSVHGEKIAVPTAGEPAKTAGVPPQMVAIGASAGGPAALAEILSAIPKYFSASIIIVQHVDERFVSSLVRWLDGICPLPVRAAREGEAPAPGTVLVAGTNDHLVLTPERVLSYTAVPADSTYRPCIDVFFQSAVRNWGQSLVGVLLTGMGRDGAVGLKAMRDAGYFTISQDAATSAVYGMPKAADEIHAAAQILPLPLIAPALIAKLQHVPTS